MSEKRVREAQFWALGFSYNRQRGSALKNLAGALPADGVGCTLSLVWEVKMEIPVNRSLP